MILPSKLLELFKTTQLIKKRYLSNFDTNKLNFIFEYSMHVPHDKALWLA
jgi:hypothetical protein